jgi:cobalt-zinc-cadmium efflux system protein
MLVIALGGLAVNLAAAAILHSGKDESMNVRGAFLHVLADALGSLGAVASGALILTFGWTWADPAASFLIGLLVLVSAWGLLRQAVGVLMQMAPAHLDMREVTKVMQQTSGVCSVHDVHAWTVTSGREVLSAHVVIEDASRHEAILRALQEQLRVRFGLDHVTLQLEETQDKGCDCSFGLPVAEGGPS